METTAAPKQCPRRARAAASPRKEVGRWIRVQDLWVEPFRLFFPLAGVAGLIGVGFWPLMLRGWIDYFPNVIHARLMVMGFYGGFVFGFLGTSIPRLLGAPALRSWEVVTMLGVHIALVICYTLNQIAAGDYLVVANALFLTGGMGIRILRRKDLPSPGFLMILPGLLCLIAGLGIAEADRRMRLEGDYELLFRLLTYHGYILLCLLGAGSFLLPRFLGVGVRRSYGDDGAPGHLWRIGALITLVTGFAVFGSYFADVSLGSRVGATIRAVLVSCFLWWEIPFERLRWSARGVQPLLIIGIACLPAGIFAAGWWPGLRVGLGHIELVTGFGFITLAVATRVVFGHSGNRDQLERFHPWISLAALLVLLAVPTRIAGEIWPQLMISHYLYGALGWMVGLAIWMAAVIPKVLRPDPEV